MGNECGIYTRKELCEHFDCSLKTLGLMLNRGEIPYIRLGTRKVVPKQALAEFERNLGKEWKP